MRVPVVIRINSTTGKSPVITSIEAPPPSRSYAHKLRPSSSLDTISNPRVLKFWLNDLHRKPTLSLYRRLLQHSESFTSPIAAKLRSRIRSGFRGSTGKGLRSITKTQVALNRGYQVEEILRRAIEGDEASMTLITDRFKNNLTTHPPDTVPKAQRSSSKDSTPPTPRKGPTTKAPEVPRPPALPVDSRHNLPHLSKKPPKKPKKPTKPPHFSFTSLKQPFLRPRFGRHNQSLSMTLLTRTKQNQSRIDLQTTYAHYILLGTAEDTFYRGLGVAETGWSEEFRLASAFLASQMELSERRRAQRWRNLEEIRLEMEAKYVDDLARWRKDLGDWRKECRENRKVGGKDEVGSVARARAGAAPPLERAIRARRKGDEK